MKLQHFIFIGAGEIKLYRYRAASRYIMINVHLQVFDAGELLLRDGFMLPIGRSVVCV
jgi:hypothetical protein